MSDLKDAMAENTIEIREKKISKLKTYLDTIVEDGRWDIDDIFQKHNFDDNATFECVVYYLSG